MRTMTRSVADVVKSSRRYVNLSLAEATHRIEATREPFEELAEWTVEVNDHPASS